MNIKPLVTLWSVLICMMTFIACNEGHEERLNEDRTSNDLCDFDQGVIVAISYRNTHHQRLECLINDVGHDTRITNTLYTYIDKMYEPGDTIKCSYDANFEKKRPQRNKTPERDTRVPTLE